MTITTLNLAPLLDERGRNEEARARYLLRVRALGPAVPPDEVLLDWFQEQPNAAQSWQYIDLSRIAWGIEHFPTASVPGAEIFRGGSSHFTGMLRHGLTAKPFITATMRRDGTWSVLPILLQTNGMTFLQPPPTLLKTPLHLAESYHRLACFHAMKNAGELLAETHCFWVGRPIP